MNNEGEGRFPRRCETTSRSEVGFSSRHLRPISFNHMIQLGTRWGCGGEMNRAGGSIGFQPQKMRRRRGVQLKAGFDRGCPDCVGGGGGEI